jgi:carboxyl-terminal processing protease
MRKAVLFLCGIAAGAVFTIAATQMRLVPRGVDFSPTSSMGSSEPLDRFAAAFAQVRARYVEKPGDAGLVDAAVEGMLASLEDSSYVGPVAANNPTGCAGAGCPSGETGLEVAMENGLATVVSALDGTAAAKAGILSRDILAEIDGESTQGLNLQEVAGRLAGPTGATIQLKIVRPGAAKPIAIALTREAPGRRSVDARVVGDVGYLRIARFDGETSDAVKKAVVEIEADVPPRQLKGYVLDLRNNPGGLLESAVAVAQTFLDGGEIVAVRGRHMTESKRFSAGAGDLTHGKPLMLLVNGGSAAAAEVVAGALQDNKRATIVGTRSFGRGSATSTIALSDAEGAIRLTTGRYFTPSGRPIDASGIKPDVEARQDVPGDLGSAQAAPDKQSYIPPAASADKALNLAYAMLRGTAAAAPAAATAPN